LGNFFWTFDAFSSREPGSTPDQVRGRLSLENALKTERTGPGTRADALGEVFFYIERLAGLFKYADLAEKISEPIQDLVGPEPLEPVQRLVQGGEFLVRDTADLLHRLDVLLIAQLPAPRFRVHEAGLISSFRLSAGAQAST
jgi:hypothetical protein